MRLVQVLLTRDTKILLVKCRSRKDFWELPGGKVKVRKAESDLDAAIREVEEETALLLHSADMFYQRNEEGFPVVEPNFGMSLTGYISSDFSGQIRQEETEEILTVRWFDRDDVCKQRLFPTSKRLLLRYKWRQRKFGPHP